MSGWLSVGDQRLGVETWMAWLYVVDTPDNIKREPPLSTTCIIYQSKGIDPRKPTES